MKTKLTLSVDESLAKFAKMYASRHGTSLSRMFEDTVREKRAAERPSFARKWRGKLKKADRPDDARMRALERKYG